MHEQPFDRELVVRLDGVGDDGPASVIVYRYGAHIEIVATEQLNGDAAVFLNDDQASQLAEAILRTVRPR